MLVFFFFYFVLCVNLLKIAWENQVGRTLTHTHTHTFTHTHIHLYTHIRSIPLNEAASLSLHSAAAAPLCLLASCCIHQAFHTHTHTCTHRVPSKKKWLPPLPCYTVPLLLLGHTTPLACRALKSINSFWSCTNRDSLRFLSPSPSPSLSPPFPAFLPLSLSTYFYFLCAYFALFTPSSTFPLANLFCGTNRFSF